MDLADKYILIYGQSMRYVVERGHRDGGGTEHRRVDRRLSRRICSKHDGNSDGIDGNVADTPMPGKTADQRASAPVELASSTKMDMECPSRQQE